MGEVIHTWHGQSVEVVQIWRRRGAAELSTQQGARDTRPGPQVARSAQRDERDAYVDGRTGRLGGRVKTRRSGRAELEVGRAGADSGAREG